MSTDTKKSVIYEFGSYRIVVADKQNLELQIWTETTATRDFPNSSPPIKKGDTLTSWHFHGFYGTSQLGSAFRAMVTHMVANSTDEADLAGGRFDADRIIKTITDFHDSIQESLEVDTTEDPPTRIRKRRKKTIDTTSE